MEQPERHLMMVCQNNNFRKIPIHKYMKKEISLYQPILLDLSISDSDGVHAVKYTCKFQEAYKNLMAKAY
jgi:hypothetical protein